MTLDVTVKIPAQRIADLMCSAAECNDMTASWCWGLRLAGVLEGKEHDLRTHDGHPWYCNSALYERDDFVMTVFEIEDESEDIDLDPGTGLPNSNVNRRIVNAASLAKGFSLMATQYPWHLSDIMQENEDAVTADVFLQLISLGDIVYG